MRAFGWLAAAIERERVRPPYASSGSLPSWWTWTLTLAWAMVAERMVEEIGNRDGIVRDSMLRGVRWSW